MKSKRTAGAARRERRTFSLAFKAQAVRLVAERRALGVTLAEVGQELDVRPRRSRLEVRRDHAPSARVRSATHVPRP